MPPIQPMGVNMISQDQKAILGKLTPAQRNEFLRLLEQQGRESKDAVKDVIPVVTRNNPLPLSFGEERLWFLDRLQESAVYNMLSAVGISGELDSGGLGAGL